MNRKWALTVGTIVAGAIGLAALVPANAAPPAPSPKPVQDVNVTNTPLPVSAAQSGIWNVGITGTPTVNVASLPAPTPPPLWQGTPYVNGLFVGGNTECNAFEIPEGMVLFAERATASIADFHSNELPVRPAHVDVTPLGGEVERVPIPTPLNFQSDFADSYTGSVELGVPVSHIEGCGEPGSRITVIGYLVPAPPAP